jgi:hypothetical protein
MQDASAGLTDTQRQLLFSSHRKDDALLGLILNLAFPGLGSVVQSDWGGGLLAAGLYVAGVGSVGFVFAAGELGIGAGLPEGFYIALPYVGAALVLSAYAVGILRPFFWVTEWNNDLAGALGTRVAVLDLEKTRVRYQPDSRGQPWSVEISLVSFRY